MIKTESVNTTYKTDIDRICIRYTVKQKGEEPVESINANITRDNDYIGTANMEKDGAMGISFNKGLTSEEKSLILTALVSNTQEIFSKEIIA